MWAWSGSLRAPEKACCLASFHFRGFFPLGTLAVSLVDLQVRVVRFSVRLSAFRTLFSPSLAEFLSTISLRPANTLISLHPSLFSTFPLPFSAFVSHSSDRQRPLNFQYVSSLLFHAIFCRVPAPALSCPNRHSYHLGCFVDRNSSFFARNTINIQTTTTTTTTNRRRHDSDSKLTSSNWRVFNKDDDCVDRRRFSFCWL